VTGPHASRRVPMRWFLAAGLGVALLLAFLVSPHASSAPDGLQKVAADHGLDAGQRQQALAGGPLAGYSVSGVHDVALARGLAGIAGVAVTGGIGWALFAVLKRRAARLPLTQGGH